MLLYLENGVIKDFEMRSSWIILVNPNSLVRGSREKLEEEQTQTHRGGDVKTEAGIGVMWLQAKEQPGLLAAIRSLETGLEWILPQSPRRSLVLPTLSLDFWPPKL